MRRTLDICVEALATVPYVEVGSRTYARSPEKNRPACLKLLLGTGTSVKHLKLTVRMFPIMNEEESVLVLYAAGFKDFEKRPLNLRNFTDKNLQVPEIFQHLDRKYRKYHAKGKDPRGEGEVISVPRLFEICREWVRDELIQHNTKNLFHVVKELCLPNEVKAQLVYRVFPYS